MCVGKLMDVVCVRTLTFQTITAGLLLMSVLTGHTTSHVPAGALHGNYWGYDCTRRKYGYYGEDCSQQQTLPFRSIQQLTYEEWRDYIDIIKMTRTYPSEYKAVR